MLCWYVRRSLTPSPETKRKVFIKLIRIYSARPFLSEQPLKAFGGYVIPATCDHYH